MQAEIPFPYFGAGLAESYVWNEIFIRFKQLPHEDDIQQILSLAPEGICLLAQAGRFLEVNRREPAIKIF